MDKSFIDLYSDYLICSTRQTTCTGMASFSSSVFSHDILTRKLSSFHYTSKHLWELVKSTVKAMSIPDGALVFDDTISEKPYTDVNAIVNWHYDHSKSRAVKGINLLTGIYVGKQDESIPVVYDIICKDVVGKDNKLKSRKSKNELMREGLLQCIENGIAFKWVLSDVWYSSCENMNYIIEKGKHFIMPLKTNRKVALSLKDKQQGKYLPIESLGLEPGMCREVYLEKTHSAVTLVKEEYVNKDNSAGTLYLVCSDLTATYQQIITLYQKRWKVEEYHKSLKNNSSLSKSPTRTIKTQSNHIFMSIVGYCKLEVLKVKKCMNQFALKAECYMKAIIAAYNHWKHQAIGVNIDLALA